jgi:hypothetical protein
MAGGIGRFIEIEELKPACTISWQSSRVLPLPGAAFPGQDLSPLRRGLATASLRFGDGVAVVPPLELKLFSIENATFFIGHGLDGAILTEDGRPVRQTAAFCRLNAEGRLQGAEPDLPAPVALDEVFIGFDGAWRNYFHWMCFGVAKSSLAAQQLDPSVMIAVPDYQDCIQEGAVSYAETVWRQSLAFSGLATRATSLVRGVYRARKLYFFWTAPRLPTDMMYCNDFTGVFEAMARHAPPPSDGLENVYLARSSAVASRLPPDTEALLLRVLESRGFTTVYTEGLDLSAQMAMFAHARRVVSPHGAGLVNTLFHPGGLKVLEFNRDLDGNRVFRPWFYVASALRRHRYAMLDSTMPDLAPAHIEAALDALDA